MVQIYKVKNDLNPPIMDFMIEFSIKRKRTVKMGFQASIHKSPQSWPILPGNLRKINPLVQFQETVRKWDCIDRPCRSCKLY